ncbi:unnamed protein product [Anisakis simplex]|uniref:JNK-interacting protein (inferred by orthology to a C. elegans protein) n=1 Tax=Anisakis simplex TaxID=6269 RepID=A0A0M3K3Q5_ANISI|nr:unnamed protein product [Anisakis simplex]
MNAMHSSKKAGGIWDFFSGLFSHETPQQTHRRHRRSAGGGSDPLSRRKPVKSVDFMDADYASERRAAERRQQYKIVREHMMKEDDGRLHAYGWSLPATMDESSDNTSIPVPVFCRPLIDMEPSLKVWCACGVMLRGGRAKDGAYIVGDSVIYSGSNSPNETTPPIDKSVDRLDFELRVALRETREMEMLPWESSSLLWVCSSNNGRSHVAIVDANNPNSVIEAFPVCSAHLLCVSSVPGVRESDYPPDDSDWKSFVRGGGYVKDLPADITESEEFGAVQWIELRKLDSDEDPTPTYCGPGQKPSPTRSRDFSLCESTPVASTSDPAEQGLNAVSEIVHEIIDFTPEPKTITNGELVKGYILLEKYHQHINSTKRISTATISEFKENQGAVPSHIKEALKKYDGLTENMTALPTIWMGSQNE